MPSAAILAGGRATRFGGRDKSTLVVGGRSILDRQLTELSRITDDILLVGETTTMPDGPSVRIIRDRVHGRGPLGGLDAALASARHDIVAVVACDMPYVSATFLEYLVSLAATADAVIPRTERGPHPLCAVYTRACLPAVSRRLADGRLAMSGLLDDVTVRVVEQRDAPAFDYDRLLTNVNSQSELEPIEALDALQSHEP